MEVSNSGSQTFDEDWWTMLIESSTEWTLNQSYEFKVINSLNTPKTQNKEWTLLIFCPMHYHQREWGHIGIQQKISSIWCKTQVGDLKNGVVLIPFTKCLWDDTCLPNFTECLWNDTCLPNCRFSTKSAHSTNVCDPLLNGPSTYQMSSK
jgi:hypothetical protein